MSKAKVIALARKRWGKDAVVQENKRAVAPATREEIKARIAALKARKDEADARVQTIGRHWPALLKAARFVCEANGDAPSMDKLREAVQSSSVAEAASSDSNELRKEIRALQGGLCRKRYEVGAVGMAGLAFIISASGDTWEEVLAQLLDPSCPT